MRFATTIDLGAFIWDEEMFNNNQVSFYPILEILPKLLSVLVKTRAPILFRSELYEEIKSNFPHKLIPPDFRDFRISILRLTGRLNALEYSGKRANLTTEPSLLKQYFTNSTKEELEYILTYIYDNEFYLCKYLTFSSIWGDEKSLEIQNGHTKILEVDLVDNIENLFDYSKGLKKIFQHNPKHRKVTRYFKNRKISPLRCFNIRESKTSDYVQLLLDESKEINGWYFNFDKKHEVFIRFFPTEKNVFHAFEDFPTDEIIRQFNVMENGE